MTDIPANAVVWAEVPVSDMAMAKAFYAAVLMNDLVDSNMGPNPMAVFPYLSGQGSSGHIYPGKPAAKGTGPTIHLKTPGTVEEAMARVMAAGGEVVSPVIEIPDGRFAYCLDPDGNSIGVFGS